VIAAENRRQLISINAPRGLSISLNIIQAHGVKLTAARNDPYRLTMPFSLPAHGQMS
jgi:hypothetical protein